MISRGKVDAAEPSGEHILHIAANCAHRKTVELLATCWPSFINLANDDGITPLHVATMYGQLPAIQALMQHGADPFAVDGDGTTPLDYAIKEGYIHCIEYFEHMGIKAEEEIVEEDSMAIAYTLMETTILDEDGYNDTTLNYTLKDINVTLDLDELSNSMLRNELIKMGEKPGPINDLTRGAYLRYLHKVKHGLVPPQLQDTISKLFNICTKYIHVFEIFTRFQI